MTARIPKDVVFVTPCPSCSELVVLFRKKAIALSRKILEEGNLEECKSHIAEIIAECIEPGMFRQGLSKGSLNVGDLSEFLKDKPLEEQTEGSEWLEPISERELREFSSVQLKRLDDPSYFKKHFS